MSDTIQPISTLKTQWVEYYVPTKSDYSDLFTTMVSNTSGSGNVAISSATGLATINGSTIVASNITSSMHVAFSDNSIFASTAHCAFTASYVIGSDNFGIIGVGTGAGSTMRYFNGNCTTGNCSTIAGGFTNKIIGSVYDTIGGGACNLICNSGNSTIAGGVINIINASFEGTIGGGACNFVCGDNATIGGGGTNYIRGYAGTIGGGTSNVACGSSSFIGGGGGNCIRGTVNNYSSIVGGSSNLILSADNAVIGGGTSNYISSSLASTIGGGVCNRACIGAFATIAGGLCNVASGERSTVGGGIGNRATCWNAVVAGGECNCATNYWSAVVGGLCNVACGCRNFIGGGDSNVTNGCNNVVVGGGHNCSSGPGWGSAVVAGTCNTASGLASFVGAGYYNYANGSLSGILGGNNNVICSTANESFIVGTNLTASVACTTYVNNLCIGGKLNGINQFTPVQQGGGIGQLNNKIYIGWASTTLNLQVDSTDFGHTWPMTACCATTAGCAIHATCAENATQAVSATYANTAGYVTGGTPRFQFISPVTVATSLAATSGWTTINLPSPPAGVTTAILFVLGEANRGGWYQVYGRASAAGPEISLAYSSFSDADGFSTAYGFQAFVPVYNGVSFQYQVCGDGNAFRIGSPRIQINGYFTSQ